MYETKHELHEVRITYRFGWRDGSEQTYVEVVGRSDTKRANLWAYREDFDATDDPTEKMGPSDVIRHLMLVVEQDRPNTAPRLHFGMTGGIGWSQEELPW